MSWCRIMDKKEIDKIAKKHGWDSLDFQSNIGLVSYEKLFRGWPARINVYMTKMTVATCLDHPNKGKTQLFRRHVDPDLLEKIFENPRVHTDKGYRQK